MGLFSTLLHNSEQIDDPASSSSSSSSSSRSRTEPPTVVQLFTQSPFPLTIDTAAQSKKQKQQQQPPAYAALHYTAVQCLTEAHPSQQHKGGAAGALLRGGRKQQQVLEPDLGVWNAKVDASTTSSSTTALLDALLPLAASSNGCHTYCLVVDLVGSKGGATQQPPDPSTVEPAITKMQEALVRHLIQRSSSSSGDTSMSSSSSITQTTSLYDLRAVQFGLGDQDESSAARMAGAAGGDEADRQVKIALQICVKQQPHQDDEHQDYKAQQIQKMLLYHLRKYAAALHASLVFVTDDDGTAETSSKGGGGGAEEQPGTSTTTEAKASAASSLQQPTVTVPQLPIVWKALAQGKPVWKYASIDAILDDKIMEPEAVEAEEKGEAAAAQVYSLVYGPDNHNTELIESVLRRNANYEGHWDVATDSIWKILPPQAEQSTQGKAPTTAAGDAAWLTELRDSIKSNTDAASLQTPPAKGNNPDSTNKTPNDAAVSSFFEGLLS